MSNRRRVIRRGKDPDLRVAYHEAGHAVAAYLSHLRFKSITIDPDVDSLGHVSPEHLRLNNDQLYGMSPRVRDRLERQVVCLLAGSEAERLVRRRYSRVGASSDYALAVRIAGLVVDVCDEEAFRYYFGWLRARAKALLRLPATRRLVEALVHELIARRTLTGEQARTVLWSAVTQASNEHPSTKEDSSGTE